jgi:hypothetical protein
MSFQILDPAIQSVHVAYMGEIQRNRMIGGVLHGREQTVEDDLQSADCTYKNPLELNRGTRDSSFRGRLGVYNSKIFHPYNPLFQRCPQRIYQGGHYARTAPFLDIP